MPFQNQRKTHTRHLSAGGTAIKQERLTLRPNECGEKGIVSNLIFENNEVISNVTEVANKNAFKIDTESSGKVFVYGRDRLMIFEPLIMRQSFMLNVSATQELIKRISALEEENKRLKDKNTELMGLKSKIEITRKECVSSLGGKKHS